MNKLTIIGALTRDPESRVTQNGTSLCTFTVAVNRRKSADGQPDADFFRVTAWRQLGENCAKYLAKGRKVAVVGPVSVSTYKGQDGVTRATMEVTADDVEFLTPKDAGAPSPTGYTSSATDGAPSSKGDTSSAPVGAPSPKGKANEEDAEARYVREEREAIQNDGRGGYVQVDDGELPF